MHRNGFLRTDPRLAHAYSLLREVLDGANFDGGAVDGGAVNGGAARPSAGWAGAEPAAGDPLTALGPDLLHAEFRSLWQPAAAGGEPWSAARQGGAAAEADPDSLPASAYRHWQPPSDVHAGERLAPFQPPFWTRSGPDGPLRAADALAVADCLYDFVHALERFDIVAAMACVADGFGELQADRELDREGFRHWLEELLDGLRGGEIEVSLAEAPRPVAYGRLALCETTLQIDRAPAPGAVPAALVLRLLLSFERGAGGSWRLLSAGRLDAPRRSG